MKLAENLKEARKNAKITQVNLAKMCNVSQGTIANWESGTRTPDPETIAKLAEILDVSTDYLLGIEDYKGQTVEKLLYYSINQGIPDHAITQNIKTIIELMAGLSETQQGEIIGRMKQMHEEHEKEVSEIGKYKQSDDQSDGNSSILFILTAAVFLMLLQLIR